jgi:site-specific DNA-methyltransferase (adenine-specific)/modification methylase
MAGETPAAHETRRKIGAAVLTFGDVKIYCGDCREILPSLARVSALVTDQPYGIGYTISARNKQCEGLDVTRPWKTDKRGMIKGDDQEFDPEPFLALADKIAFFGANHCSQALPAGGRWIVWDKRRESMPDDHSDCELIWTNVPGADRIHRQKWRGVVREGEENCSVSLKLHPNQKPVALMAFVLDQIGAKPGDTILDPFMGSGSTGVAAIRMGCKFIGIEIDAEHFETARARLVQERQQLRLDLAV